MKSRPFHSAKFDEQTGSGIRDRLSSFYSCMSMSLPPRNALWRYTFQLIGMYVLTVAAYSQIDLGSLVYVPGFLTAAILVVLAFISLVRLERNQMRSVTRIGAALVLLPSFTLLGIICDLRWHSSFRPLIRASEYADCRHKAVNNPVSQVAVCEIDENAPDQRIAIIYDLSGEIEKPCMSISRAWFFAISKDFAEFLQFQQFYSSQFGHFYLMRGLDPQSISRADQLQSITNCAITPV
jgi:hypothetical protein